MSLRRRHRMTIDELERKARGAHDYPSFLSGLCPRLHHRAKKADREMVDAILSAANRAWRRIRGSVLASVDP